MNWVLVIGLLMNVIALPIVARRVVFLNRLITSGQPAPGRVEGVTGRLGAAAKRQVVEVFGQKKLLKWSLPGAAHFFVFWAFLILGTVYIEAYGALFNEDFAIPVIGHWPVLGFLQDFIALMALAGIITFAIIRLRNSPERLGRRSRFKGSHLTGAWVVLFMIFNVIWSLFLFRGAASALGNLPYESGAFVSIGIGNLLDGLSHETLEVLEGIGLLLHIGVMLVFLVIVVHSKHLHIFVAPLNVMFGRQPMALGAAEPMMSAGKPVTMEDLEDLDEDAKLGVGAVEDFTWKGLLDFATCTECGRCQSQCPAWNTEKPLSPKMLIIDLRDHAFAKAPYILADESARDGLSDEVKREAARPLIADEASYGVIDPDVLWSCTNCGACVNQCPVDIEHVDHIIDMRRYQVLVENNFPAELSQLFRGLEGKGNPWNMSPTMRMDWAKGLEFDVQVVGEDLESLDAVDWLFWVGCAGAYEDRAKKTTRAVAELLNMAGVSFAVLGNGETCTGDAARRAGNEFVYQGLAQQNVATLTEAKVKQVVTTCAHCFNTLKNEYRDFGLELEVVHHTQLLNRLVRDGRLTPVADGAGAAKRSITYHDPCFLGRHNQVYSPPRELLQVLPGAEFVEMERDRRTVLLLRRRRRPHVDGGADRRADQREPHPRGRRDRRRPDRRRLPVLPGHALRRADLGAEQGRGPRGGRGPRRGPDAARLGQGRLGDPDEGRRRGGAGTAPGPSAPPAAGEASTVVEEEPAAPVTEPAEAKQSGSLFDDDGGSLFGDVEEKVEEPPAPAAKAAAATGSLFGDGASLFDTPVEEEAAAPPAATAAVGSTIPEGTSLFDVGDAEPEPAHGREPTPTPTPEVTSEPALGSEIPEGTSLFDLGDPEPAPAPVAAPADEATDWEVGHDIPEGQSLFDVGPADDPETILDADDDEPEPEPVEQPKPTSSGETNTPRTDADINQGGSLFDL